MSDLITDMGKALKNNGFLGIADCIVYFVVWFFGFCIGLIIVLLDMEYVTYNEVELDEIDEQKLMELIDEMNKRGPGG